MIKYRCKIAEHEEWTAGYCPTCMIHLKQEIIDAEGEIKRVSSEGALKYKAIASIYDGLSARQQESVDAILGRFPPASTLQTVKERIADPQIVDVELDDL